MNPYETLIDTLLLPSEVAMPMSKRLLRKKLLATRRPNEKTEVLHDEKRLWTKNVVVLRPQIFPRF